jgi:general secretion pathway protein G
MTPGPRLPRTRFDIGTRARRRTDSARSTGVAQKRDPQVWLTLLVAAVSLVDCESVTARRSKEKSLREVLFTMRSVLDLYRADKRRGPDSLEWLVREGYLRTLPIDPFTGSRATWRAIRGPWKPGQTGRSPVVDVRSGAKGIGANGTPYSSW